METGVFLAMLAAAACHAGWNAMIKLRLDPLLAVGMLSIGGIAFTLPFLPFTGLPHVASWPYLLFSLAVHIFYYIWLAEAYRKGDLGHVYPIARGSAPLMTAIGAYLLLDENPGPLGWLAITVLASGILLLSLKGGREGAQFDHRSVGYALLTAMTITTYTLADGVGARLSGSPFAYVAWLFMLDGLMMLAFIRVRFGATVWTEVRSSIPILFMASGLATAGYAIAIWAMSQAPIALVAALRETSVLFAALIGIFFLGEPVRVLRILAVLLITAGVALLRINSAG